MGFLLKAEHCVGFRVKGSPGNQAGLYSTPLYCYSGMTLSELPGLSEPVTCPAKRTSQISFSGINGIMLFKAPTGSSDMNLVSLR